MAACPRAVRDARVTSPLVPAGAEILAVVVEGRTVYEAPKA